MQLLEIQTVYPLIKEELKLIDLLSMLEMINHLMDHKKEEIMISISINMEIRMKVQALLLFWKTILPSMEEKELISQQSLERKKIILPQERITQ